VQAALLGRVALRSDREHAWISERALREWPRLKSESWRQEGPTKMIAAVQRFGWIDQARSLDPRPYRTCALGGSASIYLQQRNPSKESLDLQAPSE